MKKQDFVWLTYNTDIDNECEKFEDCQYEKVMLKLHRKNHLPKIKEIFADHPTQTYKDENDFICFEIKDMTLCDYCQLAVENGSDVIYNVPNGRCYYVPVDDKKYLHIFNKLKPKELYQLSTHKKLKILHGLSQECFDNEAKQQNRKDFLDYKSDKLNALLQIAIPEDFWEREQRKIRLITAEIAKLPNINKKLENFQNLSIKQKKELFALASRITAKYNRIKEPVLHFINQKQMDEYTSGNEWLSAEAFASENNIYINIDSAKNLSGIQLMGIAWHETNHIAMAHGDYSENPIMEDMLNPHLDYINEIENSYIFHPQEKINYALENRFIEEIIARTDVRADENTTKMHTEYAVAIQYMAKSLQRKY